MIFYYDKLYIFTIMNSIKCYNINKYVDVFMNDLFSNVNSDIIIHILGFLVPIYETSEIKEPIDGLRKLIKNIIIKTKNNIDVLKNQKFPFYQKDHSTHGFSYFYDYLIDTKEIRKLCSISSIEEKIYFVKSSYLEKSFNQFLKHENSIYLMMEFLGKIYNLYINKYSFDNNRVSIIDFKTHLSGNNVGICYIEIFKNPISICINGKWQEYYMNMVHDLFPGYDNSFCNANGFNIFGYNNIGYDSDGKDICGNKLNNPK